MSLIKFKKTFTVKFNDSNNIVASVTIDRFGYFNVCAGIYHKKNEICQRCLTDDEFCYYFPNLSKMLPYRGITLCSGDYIRKDLLKDAFRGIVTDNLDFSRRIFCLLSNDEFERIVSFLKNGMDETTYCFYENGTDTINRLHFEFFCNELESMGVYEKCFPFKNMNEVYNYMMKL